MPREIGQRARGAEARDVVGRRADHLGHHGEPARDQRRVARRAGADHAVDAFGDEVDQPVAGADRQLDVRIARLELVDARQHDARRVRAVQVEAQLALRVLAHRLQRGLGRVEFGQHADAALVERLAFGSRAHAPRGALEQPRAEPGLQLVDRVGSRRAWNVERRGRGREAAAFHDAHEEGHCVESVHAAIVVRFGKYKPSAAIYFSARTPHDVSVACLRSVPLSLNTRNSP